MIQLHSDGKSYKDKLHEVYMLEDDYNDNMAHYVIASERIRINTGNIKRKIINLNKHISSSKVYSYDSYLNSDNSQKTVSEVENKNIFSQYFKEKFKVKPVSEKLFNRTEDFRIAGIPTR